MVQLRGSLSMIVSLEGSHFKVLSLSGSHWVTDYLGSLAIREQHFIVYINIQVYRYQKQILSPELLNSQSMFWKSNFLLGKVKRCGQKVKFTMQLKIVFDLEFECIPKNELDFQNIDWKFRYLGHQCIPAQTGA